MLFRNFTPFPPIQFESRDENRNDFGVIVLRGTFQIEQGERLRLVQEQAPLVMADEYFGEPGQSSLRFESSIAPYKPKTDLLVSANAYAPGAEATSAWAASVQIADITKEIMVTGRREWTRGPTGWSLSDIEPTTMVPVQYEYAYGGTFQKHDGLDAFGENPIGTGHVDPDAKGPVPAPQILPIGTNVLEFGKPAPVAGLGPLAPGWLPRRAKAGTFNVIWEQTRWPDLPEDFTFDFYNTASQGLTMPGFANGTEKITLTNLSPNGLLSFSLPRFELATLIRFEDGRVVPGPIHLDTIHVDAVENLVYLTWRGALPVNVPIRVLEVRMKAPADVIHQPNTANEAGGA